MMKPFVFALLVVIITTAVSFVLDRLFVPTIGLLLFFQLGVVTVAILGNRAAAILAGFVGAGLFNYFFTEPRYSFHMTEAEEIINVLVFLVVAIITSHVSTHYRSQREELRQAQLRSSILLSVSHDLRTPLAGIIGTLSTLQEYKAKLTQEEQDELLQSSLAESHRLHRYIENLLQATRLQQAPLNFSAEEHAVKPVIEAAAERFPNDRIVVCVPDNLPLVHIKPSLIEQALYNLIDNSLRYSDKEVLVTAFMRDNEVEIQVRDEGPGIPKKLSEKVFQLFYSTRHRDAGEGGSGIGLAVSAGIIKAHNGQLTCLPSEHGCVMSIRLSGQGEQ